MRKPASVTILATTVLLVNSLLSSSVFSAPTTIRKNADAIVPGRSVGSVVIGEPLPASLGKPVDGDAAMGRFENTYIGKTAAHYRLDILTRRTHLDEKAEPIVVKTIRVESSFFHTAGGIHPQSNLSEIQRRYPHLVPVELWQNVSGDATRVYAIFDDRKHGIAFEVDQTSGRATAIFVHAAGQPLEVNGHYTVGWRQLP